MATKEEMDEIFREAFDDFKNDFMKDFKKSMNDKFDEIMQLAKMISGDLNTKIHRLDNNQIKSDMKDLENNNDLTINDINVNNVSAPDVDNNNDNIDDIDNLIVSEVSVNEKCESLGGAMCENSVLAKQSKFE